MPLVRLQCPACASIVKISDEIAAQHPLVRCAKCQGLVTVATSRVIEPARSEEYGDDYSYKPKKKKKKSPGSAVPIGMMVGIVVGLLVFVGAGVGIYFLINHFGGSPMEKQFKRAVANMQRIADAIDSIKTPQDVPKAFDQMKDVIADLKKMDEDNRATGINPDSEEAKKIAEKYMPEVLKLTAKMQGSMMKLALDPAIAQALRENAAKLGAGFNQLALMGGGLNMPNGNTQPSFGNNTPPSQPSNPPSNTVSQQQQENRSPPGKNTGNPFESTPSGGTTGKTDGRNPFESAGSPSKTMPPAGKSDSLDTMIAKLNSNEHFKKLEGLKEAQSAKVEEGSKAVVLDALLKLCDDSDVHQKVEVLKACKKWATTQEDKEKLGEHAEVMLKDTWARKDALRYFGENKVISASKEVAYLLKDNFERKDAAETLIAMGSEAEKAVIPHLTDLEPQVRQMAIEVLARIGTPACIPDLQKLKSDRFVGRAASQAITLINSRKK